MESARFIFDMPPNIKKLLKRTADKQGIKMSQYVRSAVQAALVRDNTPKQPVSRKAHRND